MEERYLYFLRLSFLQAQRAREHGNHPFGAVLVNPDGDPALAAENSVITQKDVTAHAELNVIRAASKKFSAETMKGFTLYSSAEPCPMCASAIVWANIRRVVYGLGMKGIYEVIGDLPGAPTLKMHARKIFQYAPWPIEINGPVLEEEARVPHAGFWQ